LIFAGKTGQKKINSFKKNYLTKLSQSCRSYSAKFES
jgi:hypothetical protein